MNKEKLKIKILEIIRESEGGIYLIDLLEELKKQKTVSGSYLKTKSLVKKLLIEIEEQGLVEERLYAEGDWRGKVDYDLDTKGAELLKSLGQCAPFVARLYKK
jgi:hypothetical protein